MQRIRWRVDTNYDSGHLSSFNISAPLKQIWAPTSANVMIRWLPRLIRTEWVHPRKVRVWCIMVLSIINDRGGFETWPLNWFLSHMRLGTDLGSVKPVLWLRFGHQALRFGWTFRLVFEKHLVDLKIVLRIHQILLAVAHKITITARVGVIFI